MCVLGCDIMDNDKMPFAFFEYDVVATVATGTIFIVPFLTSSLQNIAEFVSGVDIYGHQLPSQLPLIAEEIKKQQPFFEELDSEVQKRKQNNTLTKEWYDEKKKQYTSSNGELVKLKRMPYFEMVDPTDIYDERNTFPDDEDRIIKF